MQTKETSLRLTPDLYKRIQREAERQNMSVSEFIRAACEAYLSAFAVLAGKEEE